MQLLPGPKILNTSRSSKIPPAACQSWACLTDGAWCGFIHPNIYEAALCWYERTARNCEDDRVPEKVARFAAPDGRALVVSVELGTWPEFFREEERDPILGCVEQLGPSDHTEEWIRRRDSMKAARVSMLRAMVGTSRYLAIASAAVSGAADDAPAYEPERREAEEALRLVIASEAHVAQLGAMDGTPLRAVGVA